MVESLEAIYLNQVAAQHQADIGWMWKFFFYPWVQDGGMWYPISMMLSRQIFPSTISALNITVMSTPMLFQVFF